MELVVTIRRMESNNIGIMTTPTPSETSMNKKQNQQKSLGMFASSYMYRT